MDSKLCVDGWSVGRDGSLRHRNGRTIPFFFVRHARHGLPWVVGAMAGRVSDPFKFAALIEAATRCTAGLSGRFSPDWRARVQRVLLDMQERRTGYRFRDDIPRFGGPVRRHWI